MISIKKYPFYKQEEAKDCAAACLSMIISYYGGNLNIEKIRNLLKIDKSGTTAYHIVEGAKKIGFEATGVKCNLDEINCDDIVLPCIANVVINNSYKHFIVIYKIDYLNNYLLIADPSNKIMKMPFDIFRTIFSGILIMLYPKDDMPIEDDKNLKSKIFIYFLKKYPKITRDLVMLSIFTVILSIITSYYLELLINNINKYFSVSITYLILIMFFCITIIKDISSYFREKMTLIISEKINIELTLDTFNKILLLPYDTYRRKSTGDILTRLIDIGSIKDNLTKIYLTIIVDIPLALISAIILFLININLFLLSIIILILYLIVITLFKEYFDDSLNKIKIINSNVTGTMIESINNYDTIKGLKIVNNVKSNFERKYVELLKKSYSYNSMTNLQQFLKNLINNLGVILIYGIGSVFVIKKQMTFGSLLTFSSISNYFFEPVKNIISLEADIRELDINLKRAYEIDVSKEDLGIDNSVIDGDIEIKNLDYTYNDKNIILRNISLKINKGEKVIVFGSSGSGKSTLFKVLMKYYSIDRGFVYINGTDINDYKNSDGVLYISQNENLFTDSLINNLTLYNNVNISRLKKVISMCYIDKILEKNNLGYNMFIEDNGFNLSGGERQRIVLARSLLNKFNILIIDEGTSQIDIDLERKILENIFKNYSNKTIVVISHRRNNIDLYNRQIVLENGEIVANEKL